MKEFESPYMSGEVQKTSDETAANTPNSFPRLMVTLFHGGKELGSKVKMSKFYLIVDLTPFDLVQSR